MTAVRQCRRPRCMRHGERPEHEVCVVLRVVIVQHIHADRQIHDERGTPPLSAEPETVVRSFPRLPGPAFAFPANHVAIRDLHQTVLHLRGTASAGECGSDDEDAADVVGFTDRCVWWSTQARSGIHVRSGHIEGSALLLQSTSGSCPAQRVTPPRPRPARHSLCHGNDVEARRERADVTSACSPAAAAAAAARGPSGFGGEPHRVVVHPRGGDLGLGGEACASCSARSRAEAAAAR